MWPLARHMSHSLGSKQRSINCLEANPKTFFRGSRLLKSSFTLTTGRTRPSMETPTTWHSFRWTRYFHWWWWWHYRLVSHQDVYPGRALEEDGVTLIHPICLPPFGPVDWRMTRSCTTLSYSLLNWTVFYSERNNVFSVSSIFPSCTFYLEKKAEEVSSDGELRKVPTRTWKWVRRMVFVGRLL